jgi:hypothetical protein
MGAAVIPAAIQAFQAMVWVTVSRGGVRNVWAITQ